ncbi:MAG TPA: transketolase, partial [Patescibacteria group bacterium]|nr:transketolase [Patescibacteria group bacterium]
TMILAKTTKGKGVSFLEDKNGLHGVPLSQDDAKKALEEIGGSLTKGQVQLPEEAKESERVALSFPQPSYSPGDLVATRRAYGDALCALAQTNQFVVGLDADVKNSTYAETMKSKVPERFFDMYIAEQNMVGVAMGLSTRGNIPFVSTFGCFHERAVDQWRIAVLSGLNIKGCGSHAGVSIGEDGPTQMALEDMAIFSSFQDSVVLYPSDATSTYQLVGLMAKYVGPMYIRTTRPKTPVLYDSKEDFVVGGSKVLRTSGEDVVTIVAAGITVFEALKAYETLLTEGIHIRVIDAYSVKPIDGETLEKAARDTKGRFIVVEDHSFFGGLGDAVLNVFAQKSDVHITKLAVTKLSRSGTSEELLSYHEISSEHIIKAVRACLDKEEA